MTKSSIYLACEVWTLETLDLRDWDLHFVWFSI